MGNNKNYYKTKKMLNSYLLWKAEIRDLELDNMMLKNNYDIQALQYKESTGKTYKINNPVENLALDNKEKIEKNNKIINLNRYNINRIDNTISTLDNKFEKEVIISKFLTTKTNTWKDVAIKLDNQSEVCRKASHRAIQKISEFLFRNEK